MVKIILIVFMLFSICLISYASDVIIIDKATGQIKDYLKSVNTPDYLGRDDVVINPDLFVVKDIPVRYWLYKNGKIRKMTDEEIATEKAIQDQINEENRKQVLRNRINNLTTSGEIGTGKIVSDCLRILVEKGRITIEEIEKIKDELRILYGP